MPVQNLTTGDDNFNPLTSDPWEVHGLAGNDSIVTQGGNDQLYGDAGNDSLSAGTGVDFLHGGEGLDTLVFPIYDTATGAVTIDLALTTAQTIFPGATYTLASIENYQVFNQYRAYSTVYGTDDANAFSVGRSPGSYYGRGGDDLFNLDGATAVAQDPVYVDGGNGRDRINFYGKGVIEIHGGADADYLYGFDAGDASGTGRSNIANYADGNILDGGDGDDVIIATPQDDTIYGGDGNDVIRGGGLMSNLNFEQMGRDTIYGGDGNDDVLTGLEGGSVFAGNGNDTVVVTPTRVGPTGTVTVDGGAGTDTLVVNSVPGYGVSLAISGFETITLGDARYTLTLGAGGSTVTLPDRNDVVFGGADQDVVSLAGGIDVAHGGDGDDVLSGGANGDTLLGDAGADRLLGGSEVDVLLGGAGADVFVFTAVTDSLPNAGDRIWDFDSAVDQIDLTGIDADVVTTGNQAFTLVSAFTGQAGQAKFVYDSPSGTTFFLGDVDGDGRDDFTLLVNGQHDNATGWLF